MAELQNMLPQGWECRYDNRSGRYYYLNHYTKSTSWEDPRVSAKQHHVNRPVEHIPLQHGSPEFRRNYVYPSHTAPMPAFQIPAHCTPKSIPRQNLSNMAHSSPKVVHIQDTSITNGVTNNEQSVTKISAMFPTVPETHIQQLLKKYHNREAVVISALQVEKHPITTPGPFATPPPARNICVNHAAGVQMTPPPGFRFGGSGGGSPIMRPGSGASYASEAFRNSPKPHSPKLKLRYMKSIFPKAEETIILDVLSSNENNIQKASDALKEMGFERRDIAKALKQQQQAVEPEPEPGPPKAKAPEAPTRMKSLESKQIIKQKLQDLYDMISEQIISIALESVEYDEDKARQILQIMVQEENDKQNGEKQNEEVDKGVSESNAMPVSQSRQSLRSILLKTEKSEYSLKESASFCRVLEENENMNGGEYRSSNILNTNGPNRNIVKGANQDLLLEDYIKWQGPNPTLRKGPMSNLAKGPNRSLCLTRTYKSCGPNLDLVKGPGGGLAKGSIFAQLKGIVVGESRGK